jgi:hypothetical protein
MKIIHGILTAWALLAGLALRAESTLPTGVPSVPATDPITQALPILQAKYVDFASLHYKEGDRLSDLAARSEGRISLRMPGTQPPSPILTAVLPDNIAYCRLGSFSPGKGWADLVIDLNAMIVMQHTTGFVVDLRGNAASDYAGAARMLGLLIPTDTSLLRYARASTPVPAVARLNGPIVVLTNGQTAGAAEALAGCLKADGALVVGRATAGTGFEEDKLADGQILRFATALPVVPGDTMIRPVTPDIAEKVDDRNERAALTLIRDNHVLDVIQESSERKRMSEATLVNGQDPEWDSYLATLQGAPVLLSLPRVHDPVLVSALDSVRAIRFSELPSVPPAGQTAVANEAKPANSAIQ